MASGFTLTSAAATDMEDGQNHHSVHHTQPRDSDHEHGRLNIDETDTSEEIKRTSTRHGTNTEITATQKMLAACSGSTLTSLLVTPLDVIRVRLQAQHSSGPNPIKIQSFLNTESTRISPSIRPGGAPIRFENVFSKLPPTLGVTACCREVFWMNNQAEFCMVTNAAAAATEPCAIEETSRRAFNGTWEGLVKIARYEGASSLWKGLTPTLAMSIPANVIYFTGYDSLRTNPASPFSSEAAGPMAPLLAGGMARIISATAISPLELFRTRLWATPHIKGEEELSAFRKTVQGMKDMVAIEGYTSLWRGLTLTLWRDVPFSAIYWLGYESTKEFLHKERMKIHSLRQPLTGGKKGDRSDDHAATFTDSFIAGALSGAVAAFVTTPFDVGKTRKQVEESKPVKQAAQQIMDKGFLPTSPSQNDTLPRFLYNIYRGEGVRGLWKGCVPRMLKVAPACAIMISSYEVGKRWAHSMNERADDGEAW